MTFMHIFSSARFVVLRSWFRHRLSRWFQAALRPASSYIQDVQPEVNAHVRGVLIDWLVEVQIEYRLHSETLHLAVNLIDRFLSCEPIPKTKVQLVGIACMMIAAKIEEVTLPQMAEFVYVCDGVYTLQEVRT